MSSSDHVTNKPNETHFLIGNAAHSGLAASNADPVENVAVLASPFTSLGERPEMELDLWEGQFNLSSPTLEQFTTSLSTEDLQQLGLMEGDSSTCWGEDSTVTMGTVQHLQDQVGLLTEAHATDEERYSMVKHDNSTLAERIFSLEEQLREAEEQGQDTLQEEKKKNKELVEKLERERQIEHDNFCTRIQRMEMENKELREKTKDLQGMFDGAVKERRVFEDRITEMQLMVLKEGEQQKILREEMGVKMKSWEEERESSSNIMHELYLEIGRLKGSKLDSSETDSGCHMQEVDEMLTDLPTRIGEMEAELRVLRQHNTCLLEKNQELQGEILNKDLDEGKEILLDENNKTLAAELEEISENENHEFVEAEIDKLRKHLSDQEQVNLQLQKYIDDVLLSIMELHPELLEVSSRR